MSELNNDKPGPRLEQIRLEARLLAIENILAALFADVNRRDEICGKQFSTAAQQLNEQLRDEFLIQGPNPLLSDLAATELKQAIAALLQKIDDYTQLALRAAKLE